MKSIYLLVAVLVLSSVAGCSKKRSEVPTILSVAKNLTELIDRAPKSIINLDELEGETIYPSLVIGGDSVNTSSNSKGLFLANPVGCVAINDTIYICDRLNNAVIVADSKGNLIRKIGRAGKAPGEFLEPWYIAKSDSLMIVHDFGNARVQIFSHAFEYISSIPAAFFGLSSIAATNNHLFIHGNAGDDSNLVKVYEARKPFRLQYSLMPLVIPLGQQPMAMNAVKFAANRNGSLSVGYKGLPYIFVFDSLGRQYATIEFKGKAVENLDKPIPKDVKTSGGAGSIIRRFIQALFMLEDRTIILGLSPNNLYIIRFDGSKYVLQQRLNLRYPDNDIVEIWNSVFLDRNNLYVCEASKATVLSYQVSF